MWFYLERVLIPYQKAQSAHGAPRGNLSDLYPRWLGARELLLRHRDPYSEEITREIQIGYYGRPLDPTRASDPKDQQGFVYPVYVVFLLAPTIYLWFPVVAEGFRWLLVIVTGATVILWPRVLRWRAPATTAAITVILTLGSYQAAQGIKLQQLTLLVSGLVAGCIALLSAGYLWLAGVLLAIATIKPQLTAPLACWLLLWAASSWKARQRFAWGFVLTMALLVAGGQLVLPGWIGRFRVALAAYRQYTGGSLLKALTGVHWSAGIAGLLVLLTAVLCWRMRREPEESESFGLCLAVVLANTVVIIPMFAPYNQLLLLPGVLLALQHWKELQSSLPGRVISGIAVAVIGWQWLATAGLMFASLFLPSATLQRAWTLPLYTTPVTPLVVLALLGFLAVGISGRLDGKRGAEELASLALPGGTR